MKHIIDPGTKYFGAVSNETIDSVMMKVVYDDNISINKFRQLGVIANLFPYILFKTDGIKSIPITSKLEIYNNIKK
jgi:hypothetical protein